VHRQFASFTWEVDRFPLCPTHKDFFRHAGRPTADIFPRSRLIRFIFEKVADLKNFIVAGRYGGSLALAPDDSPLVLRDAGTQDVYGLDWLSP